MVYHALIVLKGKNKKISTVSLKLNNGKKKCLSNHHLAREPSSLPLKGNLSLMKMRSSEIKKK